MDGRTVGQVAAALGVTVKTLHHYDAVGLVRPSGRSAAGYRLYTDADLTRLEQVVVYRRLGFALEDIADLLSGTADVREHLRRQRAAVADRLHDLHQLATALDAALEAHMSDTPLTDAERHALFGQTYQDEAQQRWGDTDAWQQSARRTSRYSRQDWEQVKAEAQAITMAFAQALRDGAPADGQRARDVAERHRLHIHERFYDLDHTMHRNLGELYLQDPRFTAHYDDVEPGLAQYVRDAIHANADRAGAA
jgi:DNA-binding transcriptional MerR regulator